MLRVSVLFDCTAGHKFGASTEKLPFQISAGEERGNMSYEEVNRSIAWQFGKVNIPKISKNNTSYKLPTCSRTQDT